MSDNTPVTSVNSELISAGLNQNNPSATYTDFAAQMAKNRQEQDAQEQAIARAKELAKQAQLQTRQGLEAEQEGVNPLTGDFMTPEQAVNTIRIELTEKGLPVDEDMLKKWADSFGGKPINRQVVAEFASRFAKASIRPGKEGMITTDMDLKVPAGKSAADLGLTDMTDAEGKSVDDKSKSDGTFIAHVPEDGMYQAEVDNTGLLIRYTPGGKEQADPSTKVDAKMAESTEKQWQKLDKEINTFIKSSRGNQLTTAVIRSDRALNELATSEVLTPQVLSFIEKDLSGIFQGGVPPQAGMEGEDFTTALQKVNGIIAKYTGIQGYLHTDLGNQREYLLGLLSRLRESSLVIMRSMIASEESGYQQIINDNPPRWTKMVNDKIAATTTGLSATAQAATEARKEPTTVENIPGVKSATPEKKGTKTVPKYTVEN